MLVHAAISMLLPVSNIEKGSAATEGLEAGWLWLWNWLAYESRRSCWLHVASHMFAFAWCSQYCNKVGVSSDSSIVSQLLKLLMYLRYQLHAKCRGAWDLGSELLSSEVVWPSQEHTCTQTPSETSKGSVRVGLCQCIPQLIPQICPSMSNGLVCNLRHHAKHCHTSCQCTRPFSWISTWCMHHSCLRCRQQSWLMFAKCLSIITLCQYHNQWVSVHWVNSTSRQLYQYHCVINRFCRHIQKIAWRQSARNQPFVTCVPSLTNRSSLTAWLAHSNIGSCLPISKNWLTNMSLSRAFYDLRPKPNK